VKRILNGDFIFLIYFMPIYKEAIMCQL